MKFYASANPGITNRLLDVHPQLYGSRPTRSLVEFCTFRMPPRPFRSTISGFTVTPSRSARLFSYHHMIRLVIDFACFYLHLVKGNLLQHFKMVCHGASYPTIPRYSQSLFAVDVYECIVYSAGDVLWHSRIGTCSPSLNCVPSRILLQSGSLTWLRRWAFGPSAGIQLVFNHSLPGSVTSADINQCFTPTVCSSIHFGVQLHRSQ